MELRFVRRTAVVLEDDAFSLPRDLSWEPPTSRSRNIAAATVPPPNVPPPAIGPARPLFAGIGPETVKVIFSNGLTDALIADAIVASGYLSRFEGKDFVLPTADWFRQVVENAPVPQDSASRSLIPALMTRAFVALITEPIKEMIRSRQELQLVVPPPDIDVAIAMLPDGDGKARLQRLRAAISGDPMLSNVFDRVVARLIPTTSGQTVDDLQVNALIEDLTQPRGFGQHDFVRLAVVWYGLLLSELRLVRDLMRVRVVDTEAVIDPIGEVRIRRSGRAPRHKAARLYPCRDFQAAAALFGTDMA